MDTTIDERLTPAEMADDCGVRIDTGTPDVGAEPHARRATLDVNGAGA